MKLRLPLRGNGTPGIVAIVCCPTSLGTAAQPGGADNDPNRSLPPAAAFAAASASDLRARVVGPRTSAILRQQVVIESRPGVAGVSAAEGVASPD